MKVLDKGEVRLIDKMGDDLSVVAAARVSNGVSFEEASKGLESDKKLIKYLVKHRHGTPFEHTAFKFYVKAPLFVRSEWHRHRMASYNEISGRYVEYKPEFYIPDLMRIVGSSNKQGSIFPNQEWLDEKLKEFPHWTFDGMDDIETWNEQMCNWIAMFSNQAFAMYLNLLSHGVAREMARMVLPTNLYTEFYVTMNARGLMNFLSLRAADDAQWEIRQYGLAMKGMFREAMPLTYTAWEDDGFIAP